MIGLSAEEQQLKKKRDLQNCFNMRTMFVSIKESEAPPGSLVFIVLDHFRVCSACREWADKKGWNWEKVLREAL